MEIVFVRPIAPFNRYIQNVPLNYIHLAAYLRQNGHKAAIFDMVVEDNIDRLDRYVREVASITQFDGASPLPVDPFFVVRAAVSRQRSALRRVGVEGNR